MEAMMPAMDVAGGKSSCSDVSTLMQNLQQALALEAKFQPRLQLPPVTNCVGVSTVCLQSCLTDANARFSCCRKVERSRLQ